jgi:hypothetical protein
LYLAAIIIIGKYQHFSDPYFIDELAEIGGVYPQIIGQVFMRNQLQNMRAALQQLPEFIF